MRISKRSESVLLIAGGLLLIARGVNEVVAMVSRWPQYASAHSAAYLTGSTVGTACVLVVGAGLLWLAYTKGRRPTSIRTQDRPPSCRSLPAGDSGGRG
jgi:hypothetical protein